MLTVPVLGAEDDFDIRVWWFDSLLHALLLMLYFRRWFCLRLSWFLSRFILHRSEYISLFFTMICLQRDVECAAVYSCGTVCHIT